MNTISTVCTDALSTITSYNCGGLKGNRIHSLIIGKSDMTLTVSGDAPTLSEIQTGMAASADNKLVVLTHISNGLWDEVSSKELTDLDTESGLPEKFDVLIGMTGNIKRPTEDALLKISEYNEYPTLRVWGIDNKGYIWGGKTGYLCGGTGAFSPKKMDGTVMYVSFNLVYNSDQISDDTAQDDGFLTLDNT